MARANGEMHMGGASLMDGNLGGAQLVHEFGVWLQLSRDPELCGILPSLKLRTSPVQHVIRSTLNP